MVTVWDNYLTKPFYRRCIQCGERIDPVILQNRRRQDEQTVG